MKAMLIKNQVLSYEEVDNPILNDESILIDVVCVGVNRADLLQRDGKYPSPAGWPHWMGLELSGVISKMGKVAQEKTSLKVGDKVCALVGGGAYAEQIVVPYQLVLPMPNSLSFEEASAIPEVYTTSYLNLFFEGKIQKGDICYIAAGASGLASAAIPMAKVFGAHVITSVQNKQMAEQIKHLNADYVINQEEESIPEVFARYEKENRPVKVVMDCLSGEEMGEALQYMAKGGYWVVISTLAGIETKIYLRPLLTKGLHIVGSMLRNKTNDEKQLLLNGLKKTFWPNFENGSLKVNISKVFPIEEVETAHQLLLSGKNVGKIVLKVRK